MNSQNEEEYFEVGDYAVVTDKSNSSFDVGDIVVIVTSSFNVYKCAKQDGEIPEAPWLAESRISKDVFRTIVRKILKDGEPV